MTGADKEELRSWFKSYAQSEIRRLKKELEKHYHIIMADTLQNMANCFHLSFRPAYLATLIYCATCTTKNKIARKKELETLAKKSKHKSLDILIKGGYITEEYTLTEEGKIILEAITSGILPSEREKRIYFQPDYLKTNNWTKELFPEFSQRYLKEAKRLKKKYDNYSPDYKVLDTPKQKK